MVLVYKLAQGRTPTPLEYYVLTELRDNIGFTRGAVLSVGLRNKALYPTWDQCRAFLNRISISDFQTDRETAVNAKNLAAVPRRAILRQLRQMAKAFQSSQAPAPAQPQTAVPYLSYNIYFGYLHAHSELSDGEGSPLEAYTYARDQGGLDFFALTDHGEFLGLWPWENRWEQLVEAAESTYQPGIYVTLWGFEWSNPMLGHINVMNTPDFTSVFSDFGLGEVYAWIVDRSEAFARFNHPGDYDYLRLEFFHLLPFSEAVPQMVGIETWNGTESFDIYYYEGCWWPFIQYSYWDVGNLRGWYLGALGGQDNHSPHWGTRNEFRTAVLAKSLTREAIIDAYRNRRFYVTEDKDLYLTLRCKGYPMGARLFGVAREFVVMAWDASGDTFQEIRFYRNGNLLQTKEVSVSSSFAWAFFNDPFRTGSDYYYVIVRQNDDNDDSGRNDEAISSPIWID